MWLYYLRVPSALLAPQPIEVAGHFFFIDRLIAETVRGSRVSAAKADQLNEPPQSLVAAKMNVQPQSIPSRSSLWFRLSSLAAAAGLLSAHRSRLPHAFSLSRCFGNRAYE